MADSRLARRDLTTVDILDVVPVRLADWEVQGDRVTLIRPRPRAAWYLLPLEWFRYLMAVRRIRLDAVGGTAWLACDGARTTRDLVLVVRNAFGADAEPVEQRLGQLVRRLRREGLIAYRDLDRLPGPPGRAVESPLT